MVLILLAALFIVLLAVAIGYSLSKTPPNLSGFYGAKYFLIGAVAIVATIALLVVGITTIV